MSNGNPRVSTPGGRQALINTAITLNKVEKEYEKAFCDAINRMTDIKLPPHNKNKSQFNPDLSKWTELR